VVEQHPYAAAGVSVDNGVGDQLGQAQHRGVSGVLVDAPLVEGVLKEPAGFGDGWVLGCDVVDGDERSVRNRLVRQRPVRARLAALGTEWEALAVRAAREVPARVVASGTSPMPVRPEHVHDSRYDQMVERFGTTEAEHLVCGCHVHVSVASDEEAVGVIDRIRVWLPAWLAINANSPFWQGQDTGYASFRSQAMVRWPSAGPTEVFGSAAAYHRIVSDMVASRVLLDEDMVYFDAACRRTTRPSKSGLPMSAPTPGTRCFSLV
jgi:gamma-glutamyl:cysteine ligase YbdK (ATP-grasp superfamily)